MDAVLKSAVQRVLKQFAPPVKMTVVQWAEERRWMSSMTALPGRFSLAVTPWLREPLECLSDRRVREVVMQKSAQIGWTDGVLVNWLGYTIDVDPAATIVMFPREKTAKDFNAEKFEPAVEATPSLAAKVVLGRRDKSNRVDNKQFPGGYIKLVGSNSPGNVKSTSAPRLLIEEPDDCNTNLKGQGDAIAMLKERGKTYPATKVLVGGTPTVAGVSAVVAEMQLSDCRDWHVPCHECGEAAPLAWENVKWIDDPSRNHEVFGQAVPESTRYACPSCGTLWTDAERVRNARRGRFVATREFRGIAGFRVNELVSGFPGSALPLLAEKYLRAQHAAKQGDVGELINFWNSTLGLPWQYAQDVPDEDVLEARSEDYAEFTVPTGGLLLTAGVDVQHDRLAVTIVAWGRGEESWRVWWGELYGQPLDKADPVWSELDAMLWGRTFQHATGAELGIEAASIDSGDGNTADVVYHYVRARKRHRAMATKGSSTASAEVFRKPAASMDVTAGHRTARSGLKPYMVGVSRAKDIILGSDGGGRLQLVGSGPGRMHWYRGIRADYFKQLTAEVKAPARGQPAGRKVWQRKAGQRNEALDCEVLALHAARSLRTDIKTEAQWRAIEDALRQPSLLDLVRAESQESAQSVVSSVAVRTPKPSHPPGMGRRI